MLHDMKHMPVVFEAVRPRRRFSEVLRELAAFPAERVRVADILDAFGDRAFGALMLVFAVPNVLPMPPGVSAILGAPLLFIAAQLMLGRPALWLPRAIAERSLSRADFAAMTDKVLPYLTRFESLLQPRLTVMFNPMHDRIIGAACLILAIVLFLPIPFGNMLPAFAISAFALGLMERDGIAVTIGWLGKLASIGVLAALSTAIAAAAVGLFTHLWPF
ncbi:exopolysaccharide biosynthesis protein [Chelatococcus composti]|jgi:hypothetical protein|uniref:Exopolysaccharide biosynthesis protein n=1 Tax=Chelatococcus composti TaxID=1743235 RepID=A0A841K812_9HYPH|nr:exopolysaccharide biosynthesis protein [Chelatococcus composti]MBB6168220.1 hypothetical protein [Chelatococcus composti]